MIWQIANQDQLFCIQLLISSIKINLVSSIYIGGIVAKRNFLLHPPGENALPEYTIDDFLW